jgi:hypothetical protein
LANTEKNIFILHSWKTGEDETIFLPALVEYSVEMMTPFSCVS